MKNIEVVFNKKQKCNWRGREMAKSIEETFILNKEVIK